MNKLRILTRNANQKVLIKFNLNSSDYTGTREFVVSSYTINKVQEFLTLSVATINNHFYVLDLRTTPLNTGTWRVFRIR